MDIPPPLRLHSWLLLMMTLAWPLFFPTFTLSSNELDSPFDHKFSLATIYTHSRFLEIQDRCVGGSSALLSSSSPLSPLAPDGDRVSRIEDELSFVNGDWVQESGGSPFDHHNLPSTDSTSVFKSASFEVTDVDSVRRSYDMVSLSGRLVLSSTNGRSSNASFSLSVDLEGVYFERNEERVMCLLGNTSMPSMNQTDIELVGRAKLKCPDCMEGDNHQPPSAQNDQIMLVLRYPKVFTFSSRGVFGEMISFGRKSDENYFDKIHISSQLSSHSEYQFSADEQLLSEACSSKLDQNKVKCYEGEGFCQTLRDIVNNDILELVLQSTGSSNNDQSSNKLGPFTLESGTIDASSPLGILIHHVQCQQHGDGNITAAKVAAVLRVVDARDKLSTNSGRTGLSTMTLSAEGIWRSGHELCMVACVGSITEHRRSSANRSCESRVCLSIPLELSITERRVIFVSVSSINGDNETNVPALLFDKAFRPWESLYLSQSYKYSKRVLKQARKLERGQNRSLFLNLGSSLLFYPSLGRNGAPPTSSVLAEELTINVGAVELEVLSLGSFIWGWNLGNKRSTHDIDPPSNEEEESTIEVSGLLKLKSPYDISLSFEGIYNQLTGQMHLVGCRDIGGFRNVSSVEEGMDCEYEIRVEYPSTSTRWLLYPRARISINSRRDNSDPFYFPSVSLMTPFPYLGQPDDMMFRETFERTLRLLMLAISVQLIARQLNYMTAKKRDNPNTIAAASVSIIMVAIQAYGYGLPLYTSIEAMFSPQHDYLSDLVTKFLLVFALARTLQLWKKVIQSRASHRHERAQLNLRDTKAFFITSAVLAAGFFLSLHISLLDHDEAQRAASSNEPELNFIQYKYTHWPTEEATNDVFQGLAGYPGIVVDLFLVPQAIGNALWNRGGGKQQQATKALTSSYYIGFTALSVFVKVYECVRYPVARGKEKWYGLPRIDIKEHDYYGNLRNMMVAAAVIAVAVVVHLQQQQQKVDRTGKKKAVASDDRDLEEQLLPGSAKIM